MDTISLKAAPRNVAATAKTLRRSGIVPCVLYGNDVENTSLECTEGEIFKAYQKAGESTLVELDTGAKKVPVLFHAIDFEPVSERITHVDFYAVDMKKEIEAKIPVRLVDEAPAVKELGGILITPLDHVTVKCLPSALPQSLEVSIAVLQEFGDSLPVSAIAVPDGVVIQEDPENVLALVQEPRREEESDSTVAEGEVAEGEASEKAEGAEGASEGEKKEEGGDGAADGEGKKGE